MNTHKSKQTPTQKQVDRKMYEKLPRFEEQAEQLLLGSVFLDNDALFDVVEKLKADHLYLPLHRDIFTAMVALHDRKQGINLLSVKQEMEVLHTYTDAVPAYLAGLVDLTPTAANVASYIKSVFDDAVSRQLLTVSLEISSRSYDRDERIDQLANDAATKFADIANNAVRPAFVSMKELAPQSFARAEARQHLPQGVVGLATGLTDIDALLSGLQDSHLIIIAARPSMGKSTLASEFIRRIGCHQQIPTAFFSLEMSTQEVTDRLLGAEAHVDMRAFRRPVEDWERMTDATERLTKAPIFVDETPAMTPREIYAKARRVQREKGCRLIVIDYLQLMQSNAKHENRQQEITEITRSLKAMAKDLKCPVVALSQLSRACEQRADKRPMLSDLRESGAIEQDADEVIFIYRPEVYYDDAPKGIAEIIIGKQRSGPVGTIQLAFLKEYTAFENLDTRHDSGNYAQAQERPFGGRNNE